MSKLLQADRHIIGMIHVGALPGTPTHRRPIGNIVAQAASEAETYRRGGVDAVMIENMHDVPYLKCGVGPEIVASMTLVASAVSASFRGPVGIQILAAANREALAVAHAAGLDFIRAEGFVFAHVADEGLIESCAAELLRYRRAIGAERVQVWADIKKKHSSHAITSDIGLGETAKAAEFMRADAVIVTGSATGDPPKIDDVVEARSHSGVPVVLGSGVDVGNVAAFWKHADGFIVGSSLKRAGRWENPPDPRRIRQFVSCVRQLRKETR